MQNVKGSEKWFGFVVTLKPRPFTLIVDFLLNMWLWFLWLWCIKKTRFKFVTNVTCFHDSDLCYLSRCDVSHSTWLKLTSDHLLTHRYAAFTAAQCLCETCEVTQVGAPASSRTKKKRPSFESLSALSHQTASLKQMTRLSLCRSRAAASHRRSAHSLMSLSALWLCCVFICLSEHKVIIVGLDNAGKTTILYQL